MANRHTSLSVDQNFLAEQRARAEERAARFAREAAAGPPPLPTNRLTVSEGKVHRPRSESEVLSAFIRRKLATGASLDQSVLEKAKTFGINLKRLRQEVAAEAEASVGILPQHESRKRGAHAGLDDDLDDYFREASSPPKRLQAAAPVVDERQA